MRLEFKDRELIGHVGTAIMLLVEFLRADLFGTSREYAAICSANSDWVEGHNMQKMFVCQLRVWVIFCLCCGAFFSISDQGHSDWCEQWCGSQTVFPAGRG